MSHTDETKSPDSMRAGEREASPLPPGEPVARAMVGDVAVEVFDRADEALERALVDGLREHTLSIGQSFERLDFTVTARDGAGRLVGGASGNSVYSWAYLSLLWVARERRGTGLGRALVEEVERLVKGRGCRGMYLSTFGYQSRGFYERLGYRVFGELEDEAEERTRFYLRRGFTMDE